MAGTRLAVRHDPVRATGLTRKYEGTGVMHHTGHHAGLRLVPDKVTSWDFRKKAAFEGDACGQD
jgi:hypothetical protein